jgi:stage V sporulation protein R
MYDYGLSKIYELVVNTDPCYAFLLEGNSLLQNKLVAAHVLAHCDFFKNNIYFKRTSRQMIEGMSVNAERIRHYEFQHGKLEVETFLDAVLSIQEHVDAQQLIRKAAQDEAPPRPGRQDRREGPATPYDDLLLLGRAKPADAPSPPRRRKLPPEPEKDVLGFIMEHAPDLEDWQRDIISIVRAERLYFVPQMQTKIMNEGWASLWHARILRELDLTSSEYAEFAMLHANVLAPSRRHLNPYFVGMKIFEDIERRWDTPSEHERHTFARRGGEGRAKIFQVRELESDAEFLRTYLTRDLVDELDLYIYRLEDGAWRIVEKDWEKVRDQLVASLTNFGDPYIVVEDGDFRRNRELYLRHIHESADLDVRYAELTLQHICHLWGRPVHLESILDGKKVVFHHDGEKSTRSDG